MGSNVMRVLSTLTHNAVNLSQFNGMINASQTAE